MGNYRGALAAALLISCGGGHGSTTAHEQGTPLAGTSQKTYAPMTVKGDAKMANQAVILGTDDKNGSTVVPLPTAQSKVNVDALWVKLGPTPSGGFTPVKLSTGPNSDGSVQVGIYEELSGGTGAQWRAGIWISAFVAATALGKDLTDFQFTASSGGYIDGPSASGLMAGGFLASMTGAPIDPTVTMTGIINPDGTIGPVGGIPEKFLGAIEKGKKRLGYPIGMRKTTSEATGKEVDLVQLAKDHGAEAVEIADVYEAYKLLTGKQLPAPLPVAETEMAIDPETSAALELKYKDWQQRLASEWSVVTQMESAGKLPKLLQMMRQKAQDAGAEAEKLHTKGKIAAAYMRIFQAWSYASSATRSYAILGLLQKGDVRSAIAKLEALEQTDEKTGEVFKKIGAMRPTTLGGHLQMLSSFQAGLRAWGFQSFAARQIATAKAFLQTLSGASASDLADPDAADQILAQVGPAVVLAARTEGADILALQELEFEKEPTVNYMCSIPNVKRMSTSFQSAAAAGINYFDQILITPMAQSSGMTDDAARQQVAYYEPDYLVAYMTSHLATADGLPAELKKQWGEGSFAWNIMSLASTELAYFGSAALITKYYSLDIHTDNASGKADHVEHEAAFATMLATAERNARSNAHAARIATGGIPVQAKLAYQLAAVERDGDLNDRVEALTQFWVSSAFSQTAMMLARN